jgi:type III restriction enzyme
MSVNAKQQLWAIANRLSLRQPQRDSLEILDKVCELLPLSKDTDAAQALQAIQSAFPSVTDFEREFASLCFALATGVGKTRLMGAFIAYLNQAWGIRHFFVLAPNLTIYNKLTGRLYAGNAEIRLPGTFRLCSSSPGDHHRRQLRERARHPRRRPLRRERHPHQHLQHLEDQRRGARRSQPTHQAPEEYIGESYFDYLSKLDDLVILMDESHRYRGKAGMRAINELKPILGLELTATPQIEMGSKTADFKNVIYSYPLASALKDGFVKEPAVATRENFRAENYDEAGSGNDQAARWHPCPRAYQGATRHLCARDRPTIGQAVHAGCGERHDPCGRPAEEDRRCELSLKGDTRAALSPSTPTRAARRRTKRCSNC